jgi:2-dehydro-3-deoxygluconokinase
MAEVVTLGECLIAFVATEAGPLAEAGRFDRFVAGAEANVAVGLTRLGRSADFIGRVGADGFGVAILRRLRGEGVGIDHLVTDAEAPTGLMFRERRHLGPAQVVYMRRGSAGSRLTTEDVDAAADAGIFRGARWLHLSGITPALSESAKAATFRASELAREAGLTISLDVNLRRRLWSDEAAAPVLRRLAAAADVVLGSPDELAVVAGQPSSAAEGELAALGRAVLALGPSIVVLKLGAGGASLLSGDAQRAPVARPAISLPQVVDPVGAGDAFCAGFIAAWLEALSLAEALEWANACGAAAAATLGDQTGLPTSEELAALLAIGVGSPDTIR